MRKTVVCAQGHKHLAEHRECPYCVIEKQDAEAEEEAEKQRTASPGEGFGIDAARAAATMQDTHLCVRCLHVSVCELGRKTCDNFAQEWYVIISDCSEFFESKEETDVETKKD